MKHYSYGFRLKGDFQERVAGLHAIGREIRTDHAYCWDGLQRGEEGRIVFQYTLSGKGTIRIGNDVHSLAAGQAFFVLIPSDHCYYLPEDSTEWEFIYMTIYGKEVRHHFHHITDKYGHVLAFPIQATPIQYILRILDKLKTTSINNGYEASGYAYSFMMECLHALEYEQHEQKHLPLAISKAVSFIEAHYQEDLSLDDIVAVSKLSKYHFTRLFTSSLQQTPIQYVTKVRIQRALDLLRDNDKTIEQIAREVGYTSSNYFSKVFKKLLNETPSKYRRQKDMMPVDQLFID
ncbi:AraC family transcriptional regulator [Gracilibacillus sp. S3-1-1]|uniref:AraC family transcriptional regulator n=1 Tax=Gracilibacillus pellucidus TaxID=3095368 RepID=A0ACC6M2C1_9BACI|nr:AraC family transcriptional regulator [Gracilibacillus sp. S3-1-1]MDX8045099.1 AraC family transcriptional regulator [Gracilibacillus sp. S3-1-1]